MMQAAGTLQPLFIILAVAVLPFLLGDLIKVLIALLLLERIKSTSLGRF